ncbi:MAG: DUF72 domain-containing protein [Bacteroidota bacterium]
MKFGKLPNIEDVDFSLPANHPLTDAVLEDPSPIDQPNFYNGCTGWSMKEWVGKIYPKGTKTKDYLSVYAQHFNTIELNTTHYRIPTVETIDKWRKESTPDFRFCPKIPQTISHSRDLGMGNQQLRVFWDVIAGLEEKLGCCFIQLPPHFSHQKLGILKQFLSIWPSSIPLAIEVRHESWFDQVQHTQDLLETLQTYNKSAVITDVAGRRDVLHMGLTNATTMIRFVGNGLHPSDYNRIDAWVERLTHWTQQGLQEIYFFPHEPDNLLAPEMASYLHSKAQMIPNIQTRGPKLIEPDPEQLSLF